MDHWEDTMPPRHAVITPFRPLPGVPLSASLQGGEGAIPEAEAERLTGPGLKAFFGIAKRWSLTVEEQLALLDLDDKKSTLFKWRSDPPLRLTRDRLERVSHILGIYKALRILYSRDEESGDSWVKRDNTAPLFDGRPALQLMTMGGIPGLLATRIYLDTHRGG